MVIQEIRLKDFRAHGETHFSFGPGINLLCGPNGIGKTNVLEAIHYLCLTKSFLVSTDQYVLRHGATFFEVEGDFTGDLRDHLRIRAAYATTGGKRIFLNGSPVEKLSSLIGQIPVAVFSPEDQKLTAGGPDERRRFLNIVISQSSAVYLKDLMRYRRALKQRNEILQTARKTGRSLDTEVLNSWSSEMVDIGARIIAARMQFVDSFSALLEEEHRKIGSVVEKPTMTYVPFPELTFENSLEQIRDAFLDALDRNSRRERDRGITVVGPHRDEVVFRLDGIEVRRYASQGQHRTFGMAMKLAEYRYLMEMTEETPILLLDDVFDNLDRDRIAVFLEILTHEGRGQSIVTAARKEIFDGLIDFSNGRNRLIDMDGVGLDAFVAKDDSGMQN